jgi:4-amino-4-deoxy-L-arabinose transferase-like glycosyltransferase
MSAEAARARESDTSALRALSSTRRMAVLLAVLALAIGLRVLTFHGFWGADDGEYSLLANAMANGSYWQFVDRNYVDQFNGPAHLPYRVALIAPVALLYRLFGVSELTLVAYPLFISTLAVLLAFFAGRLFFGTRAGLITAGLYALLPADVSYATSLLPDGVGTFYASAAVLILVAVGERTGATRATLLGAGLGAGLLFGLSWLTKESVTYLVPFCGFLMVRSLRADVRRAVPLWGGVAIASAMVLGAEMSYYAMARHDFLTRMHENERSFVQTKAYLFYEGSRFGWPVGGSRAFALVKRLFLEGPATFFLNPEFLFLPLFGLVGAARAVFWRDARFTVPAVWMLSLIVMFNFASPSFQSYTPLVLLHRYLLPVLLPAAILVAGLLVRLFQPSGAGPDRRERLFWGLLTSAALLVICGYLTLREVRDFSTIRPVYETGLPAALIAPQDTVYTDPLTQKSLEFQWKYPSATRIVDFEGARTAAVVPGSFVLLDHHRLRWLDVNVSMWLTSDYGYHEPEFAEAVPPSWQVLWRNAHATLYRVP